MKQPVKQDPGQLKKELTMSHIIKPKEDDTKVLDRYRVKDAPSVDVSLLQKQISTASLPQKNNDDNGSALDRYRIKGSEGEEEGGMSKYKIRDTGPKNSEAAKLISQISLASMARRAEESNVGDALAKYKIRNVPAANGEQTDSAEDEDDDEEDALAKYKILGAAATRSDPKDGNEEANLSKCSTKDSTDQPALKSEVNLLKHMPRRRVSSAPKQPNARDEERLKNELASMHMRPKSTEDAANKYRVPAGGASHSHPEPAKLQRELALAKSAFFFRKDESHIDPAEVIRPRQVLSKFAHMSSLQKYRIKERYIASADKKDEPDNSQLDPLAKYRARPQAAAPKDEALDKYRIPTNPASNQPQQGGPASSEKATAGDGPAGFDNAQFRKQLSMARNIK